MLTVIFFTNIYIFHSPEEIVAGGGAAGSAPVVAWSKGELSSICRSMYVYLKLLSLTFLACDFCTCRYRPFVPHIPFDFYVVSVFLHCFMSFMSFDLKVVSFNVVCYSIVIYCSVRWPSPE